MHDFQRITEIGARQTPSDTTKSPPLLPITYYASPLFFIPFVIKLLINYVDIKNHYIYT